MVVRSIGGMARLAVAGVLLAAGVVGLLTALDSDAPVVRNPWLAAGLAVGAMIMLAWLVQSLGTEGRRQAGAGAALFGAGAISLGIPSVSPPPPAIATAPYWNGHAALKLETTMTVDRTYPVVVVVSGAQTFDLKAVELAMRGRGDVQSREVKVADVLEARLDGNPSSAFSIALAPSTPAIQGAGPGGDMRWKWDVTPRQAGAQALTFDLYYRISGSPDVPRRLTKADEPPIPITVNSVPFLECIVDFALKTVTGEVLPKAVGRIVETVLGIVFIGLAGWMTGLWQRLLLRWRTPSLDK